MFIINILTTYMKEVCCKNVTNNTNITILKITICWNILYATN